MNGAKVEVATIGQSYAGRQQRSSGGDQGCRCWAFEGSYLSSYPRAFGHYIALRICMGWARSHRFIKENPRTMVKMGASDRVASARIVDCRRAM